MYNELQSPGAFPQPVECVHVDLGDCEHFFQLYSLAYIFHSIDVNSVTFDAQQARLRKAFPIVLSFVGVFCFLGRFFMLKETLCKARCSI